MIKFSNKNTVQDFVDSKFSSIAQLNEHGFFLDKFSDFIAIPFETSDIFSNKDIDQILSLETFSSPELFGGFFNEEENALNMFKCNFTRENIVLLNENLHGSNIYLHDKDLNFILLFTKYDYSLLFSREFLVKVFFEIDTELIQEKFFRYTLGWPLDWNMGFLKTILNKSYIFNTANQLEPINFLPEKA